MRAIIYFVAAVVLAGAGCQRGVSVRTVMDHFRKAPYLQEWDDGCVLVRAQLMTPELKAAMDVDNEKNVRVKKTSWDSIVANKSADSMVSFRMRVEPTGKCLDTVYMHNSDIVYGFGRTDEQRSEEIKDYSFSIDKRIWMNVNGKRIPPLFCHTEQNFGQDNGRDIWVSFAISAKMLEEAPKGSVSLFFQKPTPITGVAALTWPSSLIKKTL